MDNQNRYAIYFSRVFRVIGLIFFVVGLICFFFSFHAVGDDALALRIVGAVFSTLGGIFIIISAVSLVSVRNQRKKLERLKSIGRCYDGEIVRVYDNIFVGINYRQRSSIIVECTYKDMLGKTYLVKSGNIWPDSSLLLRENDIRAKVWVNPDNPRDYFVEVFFGSDKDNTSTKYDYDYR